MLWMKRVGYCTEKLEFGVYFAQGFRSDDEQAYCTNTCQQGQKFGNTGTGMQDI